MKKLLVTLITAMMILTFAIPATVGAAEKNGIITVSGVSEGATYKIYKMLDLESYNPESGAYSYKVNEDWAGFFATEDALKYVAIDGAGYVTWINGDDDDSIAAFAKLALAYAKANNIEEIQSKVVTKDLDGKNLTFSDLELGYYLVDSTIGVLCGLTTTKPEASIVAKNHKPTIDKQVQEDSTEQWGDNNTADIGQTVYYRVTINVHAGAENYVFHDVMSEGLTFDKVTRIEHVIPGKEHHDMNTNDYTVKSGQAVTDGHTFDIVFSKEICDKFETNDKVIIYYQAMLNRNAVIAGEGNPNEAWLEYGEGNFTTHDTTHTYTFGFDIVKTDSQNTLIDGAKFKIYDAATGGNEVRVVLMDDGVTYRHARADETGVEIDVKGGKARIVGFDNGTYYLEETIAPAGYNKLTARHKFIISDANLDSIFVDDIYTAQSGVQVVNKTGSMLPQTGGFGTTMMLLFGGIVVLAAGVILFARKRMSQYAE